MGAINQRGDQPSVHPFIAIAMLGAYRHDKPFWDASTHSAPEQLRAQLDLLPQIAEMEICKAGNDISNGGIVSSPPFQGMATY